VPGALGALESARADNNSYVSPSSWPLAGPFRQFPYQATRPGTSCGQTAQLKRDNKYVKAGDREGEREREREGASPAGLVINKRCHCSSVVACSSFSLYLFCVLFSPSFVFCVFCLSVMHVRFLLAGKVLELL